jgi:hypothetical protein
MDAVLCPGTIDHIMSGSGWDDDFKSIQFNRSLSNFKPDELIQLMHFLTDFFTWFQIH